MNKQNSNLNISEKTEQAVTAADALYQAVKKSYPNRPLFFLKLDELYMNLCVGARSYDKDFIFMVEKRWSDYLPEIIWTEELGKLVNQYQRNCRKWVWQIISDQYPFTAEQLNAIDAVLKIHQQLLEGMTYLEIKSEGNDYTCQELRQQVGTNGLGLSAFVKQLKYSDFDEQLKELRATYGKPLQIAQDTLMWMGIVSMQVQQNKQPNQDAIRKTIKDIWYDVMENKFNDCDIDMWTERFVVRIRKKWKLPCGLIHYPYNQLRDDAAKAKAKFQFCTAYTIACTKGRNIENITILNSTIELLKSSFKNTESLQNVNRPISHIINRYCNSADQKLIDTSVVEYFQLHYDFTEECFERMRRLDEDDIRNVENEIIRQKTRAAEDIALMYQEREDETLGKLLETLSNPIHGNVIGQMYLISNGEKENIPIEEIRRLLGNFFLLMQQKMIMPVWDNHSLYPGWSVRGKMVVKSIKREDERK